MVLPGMIGLPQPRFLRFASYVSTYTLQLRPNPFVCIGIELFYGLM